MPFTLPNARKAAANRQIVKKVISTKQRHSPVVKKDTQEIIKSASSGKHLANSIRPREHHTTSAPRPAPAMAAKVRKPVQTSSVLVDRSDVVRKAVGAERKEKKKTARERRRRDEPLTLGYKAAMDAGFELVETEADGNCLFNAISAQLHGNESHHRALRKRAVDFQWAHRDEFKHLMTGTLRETRRRTTRQDSVSAAVDQEKQLRRYLNNMEEDATWGGEQEVAALSRALDIHICVYYAAAAKPVEYNEDGKRSAYLYYDEAASHYSGLVRQDTPGLGNSQKQLSDTESSSSKRSFSERDDDDGSDEEEPRKKSKTGKDTAQLLSPARRQAKAHSKLSVVTRNQAAARPSSSSSSTAAATSFSTSGSNTSSPDVSRSNSPEPQPRSSATLDSTTKASGEKIGTAGPKEKAASARFDALKERIRSRQNKSSMDTSGKEKQQGLASITASERSSFETQDGSITTAPTTRTGTPDSTGGLSFMGGLDLDEKKKSMTQKL